MNNVWIKSLLYIRKGKIFFRRMLSFLRNFNEVFKHKKYGTGKNVYPENSVSR